MTPRRAACFAALATILLSQGCGHSSPAARKELSVAAAANLTAVAEDLGRGFEAEAGIHPVFSFASTAQLTQQIENGAPFDVFLAADSAHAAELEKRGLLVPQSRAPYAIGVLALWIPPLSTAHVARIEDLVQRDVRVIAIAKPELAPYGQAAVEALQRSGIWEQAHDKIVYAENINMTRQYGVSGNADAVFSAESLVRGSGGVVIPVDEKLHQPIVQDLGIVATSPNPLAAQRFVEFVRRGGGRQVLLVAGYRLP